MKKIALVSAALLCSCGSLFAQRGVMPLEPQKTFTVVKQLPITPVKNQASSGTCWCYSTISFLESELLRTGKGEVDLAEMYVVSKAYQDKAEKFVRLDGHLNFGQGSSFGDVITTIKKYGIVPQPAMEGLNYGEPMNKFGELHAGLSGYLNAIAKNPNRKLTTAWKSAFEGILNAYLGECPSKFNFNGKEYTPQSYADELGLNMDDYVSLTSFTHHPFYSQFIIEVPDNWRWDYSYNLPLDELMKVMYNAIETGYTIAWGSDVSERGFTRNGIGIMPDIKAAEEAGSDEARWIGVSPEAKTAELKKLQENAPEMVITQEMRQEGYDNKQTTDDHGMHIFGTATDQNGVKYFMVKNSWGDSSKYKGIWYVSDAFVQYKTINIVVHKDAIPKDLRKKLNIK